jgi:hypothetical protein
MPSSQRTGRPARRAFKDKMFDYVILDESRPSERIYGTGSGAPPARRPPAGPERYTDENHLGSCGACSNS